VRERDVRVDSAGLARPGTGGMSVTPDDSKRMPAEFLPETLGGLGRLPLYSILGPNLIVRPDPRNPDRHAFVEPAAPMPLSELQQALCLTAATWKRFES
jgi:hypothetical protein